MLRNHNPKFDRHRPSARSYGHRLLGPWARDCPGSLIAFLIGLGHSDGFVSVLCRFESNSFMVVGPGDYDWQAAVTILPRDRVIGTPLAKTVFQTLDEIRLHDPELIEFLQSSARRFSHLMQA